MTLSPRFALLVALALAGCRHAVPIETEVRFDATCAGQLVLEFTNRLEPAVQVGWIPIERLQASPGTAEPIWLGVVALGTVRFKVPGPGRVITRTANPAGLREDRHEVVYRLLCQQRRR